MPRILVLLIATTLVTACADAPVPPGPVDEDGPPGAGVTRDPPPPSEPPPIPRTLTQDQILQADVNLPNGFVIRYYAQGLFRPRSLAEGDDGSVYVSTYPHVRGVEGPLHVLRDTDGDGRADSFRQIRNGFRNPNGIAYRRGTLFVVDEHQVFRIDDIEEQLEQPGDPIRVTATLIYDRLPSRDETDEATDVGHFWRYVEIGPDDKLYISVGTRWSFLVGEHTANDLNDDAIYSTIVRMDTDGSNVEIFADGVRNSMGLAFHPTTGDLWFTDNGASWPFNDPRFYDIPPDELNRASQPGLHFGFPYIHAKIPDPLIGDDAPDGIQFPVHGFEAHTAPLGLEFYVGSHFPERYRNGVFIAEHGTEPTTPAQSHQVDGDRVSFVVLDADGRSVDYEVFVGGMFNGSNAAYSRRPVDLLSLSDGSLLISDDRAGAIYRVTWEE